MKIILENIKRNTKIRVLCLLFAHFVVIVQISIYIQQFIVHQYTKEVLNLHLIVNNVATETKTNEA